MLCPARVSLNADKQKMTYFMAANDPSDDANMMRPLSVPEKIITALGIVTRLYSGDIVGHSPGVGVLEHFWKVT